MAWARQGPQRQGMTIHLSVRPGRQDIERNDHWQHVARDTSGQEGTKFVGPNVVRGRDEGDEASGCAGTMQDCHSLAHFGMFT